MFSEVGVMVIGKNRDFKALVRILTLIKKIKMRHINNQQYKKYLEKAFPDGFESIQLATDDFLENMLCELNDDLFSSVDLYIREFFTITVKKEKALELLKFLMNDENSQFTELRSLRGIEKEAFRVANLVALIKKGHAVGVKLILFSPTFCTTICVKTSVTGAIMETIYQTFIGKKP